LKLTERIILEEGDLVKNQEISYCRPWIIAGSQSNPYRNEKIEKESVEQLENFVYNIRSNF